MPLFPGRWNECRWFPPAPRMRLAVAICLAAAISGGCGSEPPPPMSQATATTAAAPPAQASQTASAPWPKRLTTHHLPNAWQLHERVISGGQPDGEAGFAELQALGIRTLISVDGAVPDLALAARYGLRYVHLPHGYDGVPEERVQQLAKAVRELPGPIYVHCHHGKHRSPAAAATACVALGYLSREQGLNVLKQAGTSPQYRGLYASAEHSSRLDDRLLDDLSVEFKSVVPPAPLAAAMVQIEHTQDHLLKLAARNWQPLPESPDQTAAHEALLLKEHLHELGRTPEVAALSTEFRRLLSAGEAEAAQLETALLAADGAGHAAAQQALEAVSRNCKACHQAFRDVPLGEKQQPPTPLDAQPSKP